MSTEPFPSTRLRGAFLLVPPLVLLGWLFVFGGWNVPFGDDISMAPIFDKFYRSTLTFGDLWEPYQGHRILFHRSLELLFGCATHWNTSVEIAFVYLTFLGDFALLYWLLQDLRPAVSSRVWLTLAAILSLSIFSTSQVENWTNGWQMGLSLSVLSVVGGVVLLAKFGARPGTLVLCVLAGIVASYSFGNGLTYWGALVPLLYIKLRDDPRWLGKALLWAAAAGVVVFFYFYHFGGTGTSSTTMGQAVLGIARLPGKFLTYLLTCSGAGVFFLNGAKANLSPSARLLVSTGAPACGLVGLVAFAVAAWRLWRRGGQNVPLMAPWLSLGLYGVFSVGMTSLTRYMLPPESAIGSRYITYSQYLWLALFVFLALLAPQVARAWRLGLGGLLVVCYLISYGNGVRRDRATSATLRQIRTDLLGQPTARTYNLITPDRDPAQVAEYVELMRRNRLSVFRKAAAP